MNGVLLLSSTQGPFTEEFVFRACMLPVLVPSLGENWSLLLCPLFFGFGKFTILLLYYTISHTIFL